MPMDVGGQPSADRLWQIVIALGGLLFSAVGVAIGHLHMRLNAMDAKADGDRTEAERIRRDSMAALWAELRKMSEASADWREKQATILAEKPTLNQIREMLDDRENRRH
jgi:hypothetical protein